MSLSRADLRVDWCSHEAAKYAVENWHYSKRMPSSKLAKLGVWENDEYIGCVIFGSGANKGAGKRFDLTQFQVCECVRVALHRHLSPVSQIVTVAVKMVKEEYKKLRLIVSYADPEQGHSGSIYQAMNWIYAGDTTPADEFVLRGRIWHGRGLRSTLTGMGLYAGTTLERATLLDASAIKQKGSSKHRYLYPLDKGMRRRILPLSRPYPKREESMCGFGVNGDIAGDQLEEAGSIPASRS